MVIHEHSAVQFTKKAQHGTDPRPALPPTKATNNNTCWGPALHIYMQSALKPLHPHVDTLQSNDLSSQSAEVHSFHPNCQITVIFYLHTHCILDKSMYKSDHRLTVQQEKDKKHWDRTTSEMEATYKESSTQIHPHTVYNAVSEPQFLRQMLQTANSQGAVNRPDCQVKPQAAYLCVKV